MCNKFLLPSQITFSTEKRGHFSVIWVPNPHVSFGRHLWYTSRYGHKKTPPQVCRVRGNPIVTHAPYLHPPLWFLSCFFYLFQNDSSTSTHSSKTKHCLVRLYGRIWSHTQRLGSKALLRIMLTPEEQCFTCKLKKCQIYLCLSNFIPFLSDSTFWCMEWSKVCHCLCSRWQINSSYRREAKPGSSKETRQMRASTEQTGYASINKLKTVRDISASHQAKRHSLAHTQAAHSHCPLNRLPVTASPSPPGPNLVPWWP